MFVQDTLALISTLKGAGFVLRLPEVTLHFNSILQVPGTKLGIQIVPAGRHSGIKAAACEHPAPELPSHATGCSTYLGL